MRYKIAAVTFVQQLLHVITVAGAMLVQQQLHGKTTAGFMLVHQLLREISQPALRFSHFWFVGS
jgi:hypothetical protein